MFFYVRQRFSWLSVLMLSLMVLLSACSGTKSSKTTTKVCRNLSSDQYCVQSGDTLKKVAQRYRTNITNLKAWNNLSSDNIRVGQVLVIRGKNTAQNQASNQNTQNNSNSNSATSGIVLKLPLQTGNLVEGYNSKNKGLDIEAPRGTMVYAAADGTVIYAGEGVRGYGKLLLIRHSPTTLTAYAHNDSLAVSEKMTVKAGQMIATVGDSGRTDGRTILHFELRINGKHVNPAAYLRN